MTGSQILIETLIEQGTEVVFGYPGGQVINLYDALYEYRDRIRHVLTAHEQGAAHAGDGYARTTGKVGVVIATSGPGATNLVTGIANAYLDSVPMVFITGNVPCALIGRDSFQEVDIAGITMPIVKHNYVVKDVTKLADTVREAFLIAKSGRPGPTLIDIPKDIQCAQYDYTPQSPEPAAHKNRYTDADIAKAAKMINEAKRPYIFCGGGVVLSDAEKELMALAEKIDAPVGCTMMGLSGISAESHRKLGMVGMHGIYTSTVAKTEADLIITLGSRFSERVTGNKDCYLKKAKIIHIDVDPAELDKNITATLGVPGDIKDVVNALLPQLEQKKHPEWFSRIEEIKKYENENSGKQSGVLTPYGIIDAVASRTLPETPVCTDVGQHQMWVAQRYPFKNPRTLVTSGGLGTMGFGLGAAVGSCVATGKRTVLFTGDGSFGMNLNELATAVTEKLPIVIVLLNNGVLGMVRQWQTMFFDAHYSNTTLDRKTDFVALAKAFGASAERVTDEQSLSQALDRAFASDTPYLIDCPVEMNERVLPMIPPGGTVEDLVIK